MSAKKWWKVFSDKKKIQFRWSKWLSQVLAHKKFSRRELLNKALCKRISYDLVGPSHLPENLSGWQKAADYVKMLNYLSLAPEGHCLCGEEWIFLQDNAAIHNVSITKKYLFERKIKLFDHPACSQSYRKFVGIDCSKSLWRRLLVLSNFWIQKCNLRYMGKNSFDSTSKTSW